MTKNKFMRNKKILTGVLSAALAVGGSFAAYADTVTAVAAGAPQEVRQAAPGEAADASQAPSEAPAANSSSAPGGSAPAGGTDVQLGVSPEAGTATVQAGSTAAETTAAETTAAETQLSSPAPAVEAGASQAPAGSATVTAGSATVQAGSSTTVQAGSSTTVQAGSGATAQAGGGSTVIQAGLGLSAGPGGAGPGMVGGAGTAPAAVAGVSDGNTSFAGTIQNPIVTVTDRYSYDQMCRDIRSMESRYGSQMNVNVIGTTLDGRSLYEIVLGNPNASKHILIHAGIHAREYMTPLLVMKQLEHGLAFYSTGSFEGVQLSSLLNQVAIHYVPMVNPDGISLSQFGISAIRSEQLRQAVNQCYASDQALGRTSAAFDRYLNYWKANGRGVDLNQNFPADWEQVTSAPAPSYATYRGPGALSEPESQALANLMNSRSWALTVSYHSMGNIIYWDYAGNKVSDQSKALADLVSAKTGYRLAGSSGHGGFKDWVQIKDNPVPSLTLEVGSVACPMPVSEFTGVWNSNQDIWATVAKFALEH